MSIVAEATSNNMRSFGALSHVPPPPVPSPPLLPPAQVHTVDFIEDFSDDANVEDFSAFSDDSNASNANLETIFFGEAKCDISCILASDLDISDTNASIELIEMAPVAKTLTVWDVLIADSSMHEGLVADMSVDVFAFSTSTPSFKLNSRATATAAAKARTRAKAEAKAVAFAKVCATRARKKKRDSKKENTATRATPSSTTTTTAKCNARAASNRGLIASKRLGAERALIAKTNRKEATAAIDTANKRSAVAETGRPTTTSKFLIQKESAEATRAAIATAAATTAAAAAAAAAVPWVRPQFEVDHWVRVFFSGRDSRRTTRRPSA